MRKQEVNSFEVTHALSEKTRITIVRSSYYDDLVTSMEQAAMNVLRKAGVSEENCQVLKVPGSFEIPLLCKKIAESDTVDGIIALGIIVQGETHHAGEIARACTDGLMQVQLASGIPIAHEVLFVDSLLQAEKRCTGKGNKGDEAARSLLTMIGTTKHVTTRDRLSTKDD